MAPAGKGIARQAVPGAGARRNLLTGIVGALSARDTGTVRAEPRIQRQAATPESRGLLARLVRIFAIGISLLIALSFAAVLSLRWLDPPTTAFILLDDSGRVPVMQEWTDWSAIAGSAKLAVIASEDQRFNEHFGFDIESIRKSIEEHEDGGSLRGASTITQQVAKNLFLWPGRNFVRKGIEAWFTLLIELTWSKQRILEVYLNVAEFGPGIYGVPAAGSYFFNVSPNEIQDRQAALLAAVLPNPARLQVDSPSDYVRERQRWIVGQMQRLRREAWLTTL